MASLRCCRCCGWCCTRSTSCRLTPFARAVNRTTACGRFPPWPYVRFQTFLPLCSDGPERQLSSSHFATGYDLDRARRVESPPLTPHQPCPAIRTAAGLIPTPKATTAMHCRQFRSHRRSCLISAAAPREDAMHQLRPCDVPAFTPRSEMVHQQVHVDVTNPCTLPDSAIALAQVRYTSFLKDFLRSFSLQDRYLSQPYRNA